MTRYRDARVVEALAQSWDHFRHVIHHVQDVYEVTLPMTPEFRPTGIVGCQRDQTRIEMGRLQDNKALCSPVIC
jgi:hypothetical protein